MEKRADVINRILRDIGKLGSAGLGITLIFYIIGFIVVNLFLGSLNVINIEILRSRYILVGILFGIFITSTLFLIYEHIYLLRLYNDEPLIKKVWRIFQFSLSSILIISIGLVALFYLAGSMDISPSFIQHENTIELISLQEIILESIRFAKPIIIGLVVILFIGIILFLIIKERKEGRNISINEKFRFLLKNGKTALFIFIFIFLLLFFFRSHQLISNLLISGRIEGITLSERSMGGLARYILGILSVYLAFSFILTPFFLSTKPKNDAKGKKNLLGEEEEKRKEKIKIGEMKIKKVPLWIYLISLLLITMVPLYSLGIYPYIPQGIGGGELVPIKLAVSNELDSINIIDKSSDIYLVDKTSKTIILLVTNLTTEETSIVEFNIDEILLVEYGN